jgi:hypothetical protein
MIETETRKAKRQTGTQVKPELRELVREASQALARLDAGRLEELAQCCQALNRELKLRKAGSAEEAECGDAGPDGAELARQAREAAGEFAIFTRVLEATRANLDVLKRLRAFEQDQLEYGITQEPARNWAGGGR